MIITQIKQDQHFKLTAPYSDKSAETLSDQLVWNSDNYPAFQSSHRSAGNCKSIPKQTMNQLW